MTNTFFEVMESIAPLMSFNEQTLNSSDAALCVYYYQPLLLDLHKRIVQMTIEEKKQLKQDMILEIAHRSTPLSLVFRKTVSKLHDFIENNPKNNHSFDGGKFVTSAMYFNDIKALNDFLNTCPSQEDKHHVVQDRLSYINLEIILSSIENLSYEHLITQLNLPSFSDDGIEVALSSKDRFVLIALASSHRTPLKILQVLADCRDRDVRCAVTANPNMTDETFKTIASETNVSRRLFWASIKYRTSPDILRILANEENIGVRRTVAERVHADAETLEILARDEDSQIRYNVAKNTKTHAELLEVLAGDFEIYVRQGVAENPAASKELLKKS